MSIRMFRSNFGSSNSSFRPLCPKRATAAVMQFEAVDMQFAPFDTQFEPVYISDELVRTCCQGLLNLNHAIWHSGGVLHATLWPISFVREVFMLVMSTPAWHHVYRQTGVGDTLEQTAANALEVLDAWYQQQASALPELSLQRLKTVVLRLQDLVIFLCSRYINLAILIKQGRGF